jgi:hypothetical protein
MKSWVKPQSHQKKKKKVIETVTARKKVVCLGHTLKWKGMFIFNRTIIPHCFLVCLCHFVGQSVWFFFLHFFFLSFLIYLFTCAYIVWAISPRAPPSPPIPPCFQAEPVLPLLVWYFEFMYSWVWPKSGLYWWCQRNESLVCCPDSHITEAKGTDILCSINT